MLLAVLSFSSGAGACPSTSGTPLTTSLPRTWTWFWSETECTSTEPRGSSEPYRSGAKGGRDEEEEGGWRNTADNDKPMSPSPLHGLGKLQRETKQINPQMPKSQMVAGHMGDCHHNNNDNEFPSDLIRPLHYCYHYRLTGDMDLNPATGAYRLSATVPGVDANALRATLGVRCDARARVRVILC